jgi:hypothetical protein
MQIEWSRFPAMRTAHLSSAVSRIPPSHHGLHDAARNQLVRRGIDGRTEGFYKLYSSIIQLVAFEMLWLRGAPLTHGATAAAPSIVSQFPV